MPSRSGGHTNLLLLPHDSLIDLMETKLHMYNHKTGCLRNPSHMYACHSSIVHITEVNNFHDCDNHCL
jgi:hypothetical protein